MLLGVNIDHVATLRNARGGHEPDVIAAARICKVCDVASITTHLREDRRHIKDADVNALRPILKTRLNLEMAATEEMQKNLLSKIFNPISNKKTVDNFPKIKYTQKKVDALTDKQVLKIIEDDISLIDYLETSFIVNYKDELIKAILSNTNIDVEKRFEILQNISEAKISDLNQ